MLFAAHRPAGKRFEAYRIRFLSVLTVVLATFAVLAYLAEPPHAEIELGFRQTRTPQQVFEALSQEFRSASPAPPYIPPPTRIGATQAQPAANFEPPPPEAPSTGEDLYTTAITEPIEETTAAPKEQVYEVAQLSITGRPGPISLNLEYPNIAREAGIEGTVEVLFVVQPNGRTSNARVVKSVHPLCDEAALRAIRTAIFRPGRVNGQPVSVRVRLPIRFEIKDDESVQGSR